MAKKIRVKMRCQICNKTTLHEMRSFDGEEQPVCLVCAAIPPDDRQKDNIQTADRIVEAERIRIFSNLNIPGGF
jgi:hypothetical protein